MAAALDSWHDIIRNGDASTLDTLIADDAVFHSPVVHTPQVGKALVVKYLTAAANVLLDGSFKYLTERENGASLFVRDLRGTTS